MTDAVAPPPPVGKKKKAASVLWAFAILGILFLFFAAIATPKFISFSCRSKQSEAKGNLKALFVGERVFFDENNAYTADLARIEFAPRGANIRYIYGFTPTAGGPVTLSDPNSPLAARLQSPELKQLLANAIATPTAFLAFAVGDIDNDETLDVWTISQNNDLNNLTNDCSE